MGENPYFDHTSPEGRRGSSQSPHFSSIDMKRNRQKQATVEDEYNAMTQPDSEVINAAADNRSVDESQVSSAGYSMKAHRVL